MSCLVCVRLKRMGQIAFKNPHSLQTLQTSVHNIFCDSITVSLLEPQDPQEQNFAKRQLNGSD